MLIFPIAVGAGVVLGYLLEGRLRGLGGLRFRAFTLLAVALGMQMALPVAPHEWHLRLILLSYALTGCWFLLNTRQRPLPFRCGLLVIAAGWFLNLLPIALNGGMPVSIGAIEEVSHHREPGLRVDIRKHVAADGDARLALFGDVIPIVALRSVVSVGDLFMGAGLVVTVASAMVGRGGVDEPLTRPGAARRGRPGVGCSVAVVRGSAVSSGRCCRWGRRERR